MSGVPVCWERLDGEALMEAIEDRFEPLVERIPAADRRTAWSSPDALLGAMARHLLRAEAPGVSILARALFRVREAICEETGHARATVRPDARLVDLFPDPSARVHAMRRIRARVRAPHVLELSRPRALERGLVVIIVVSYVPYTWLLWRAGVHGMRGYALFWGGVLALPLFALVATAHLKRDPWPLKTVGDVARALACTGSDVLAIPVDRMTPAQLREVMRLFT